MALERPARLTLVMATWCPHCHPLSVDRTRELAGRLKIPWRALDIDRPAEEAEADRLVREHGDWTEDYLIPQVFLESGDGHVAHLLTGVPGPVAGTARAWERVFAERAPPTAPGRRPPDR